jgi:hypothetical protein
MLIGVHKSGSLSFFVNQRFVSEWIPKYPVYDILKVSSNPLSDGELFIVFEDLGVALFDTRSKSIVARTHTFPTSITAIDADESHIAFGTVSGQVVFRNPLSVTYFHHPLNVMTENPSKIDRGDVKKSPYRSSFPKPKSDTQSHSPYFNPTSFIFPANLSSIPTFFSDTSQSFCQFVCLAVFKLQPILIAESLNDL